MKIIQVKVPVKLSRDEKGNIEAELNHDEEVVLENTADNITEELSSRDIVSKTQEITEFNNKELSMAKHSLFESDKEKDTHVIQKRLID